MVIHSHKRRNYLLLLKPYYVPSIWSNLYSHLILTAKLTVCLLYYGRKESTKQLEQPACITRPVNGSVEPSPEQRAQRPALPAAIASLMTYRQAH